MNLKEKDLVLKAKLDAYMQGLGIDVCDDPGAYAEAAITAALMAYVQDMNPESVPGRKEPPMVERSKARDYLLGTDLVIDDPTMFVMSRRITRLDVTVAFTKKNNMPLVTPTESMALSRKGCNRGILEMAGGDYMRFGIRIGNGRYGFDAPVVVAGLCSSRELDPSRVRENIAWLHGAVIENAPKIMRAANMALNRFYYMTDPEYKKRLDDHVGAERLEKELPVLVGNWTYLDIEQEYRYSKPGAAKHPRTCRANVADAVGNLVRHPYTDDLEDAWTDVPWMSKMGHAAVAAMLDGPRTPPDNQKEQIIKKILAEPVRPDGQGPAIIVGPGGTPLKDDLRPDSFRELARILDKKFHGDSGGPDDEYRK